MHQSVATIAITERTTQRVQVSRSQSLHRLSSDAIHDAEYSDVLNLS
jgi:hypothetical protein